MIIPKPEHPDKRLGQVWQDMDSLKKDCVRTLLHYHENKIHPDRHKIQTLDGVWKTFTPDEQILMYYVLGEPAFTEDNLDLWEALYE